MHLTTAQRLQMRRLLRHTTGMIWVFRRYRAARLHGEWHNYRGVLFANVGIASPDSHAWWAFTIHYELPDWADRTPLHLIPSTGYKSWG